MTSVIRPACTPLYGSCSHAWVYDVASMFWAMSCPVEHFLAFNCRKVTAELWHGTLQVWTGGFRYSRAMSCRGVRCCVCMVCVCSEFGAYILCIAKECCMPFQVGLFLVFRLPSIPQLYVNLFAMNVACNAHVQNCDCVCFEFCVQVMHAVNCTFVCHIVICHVHVLRLLCMCEKLCFVCM
jgi:hypothetical protein